MAWEASDYAIIMTSAAAFMTTIGGIGIPLLLSRKNEARARRKDVYQSIYESIFFCVENIEKLASIQREEAIFITNGVAGREMHGLSDDNIALVIEFGKNFRRAELHLSDIEVDSSKFVTSIINIRADHCVFRVIDGKLVSDSGNDGVIRRQIIEYGNIIKSSSEILKSARSKLFID